MIRARVIGRRFHSRRGLSLGEMLVVLAVFLILAAIFFMSSRGVIVKTKVSKARHEMREIDGALNVYHTTYSKFPTEAQGVLELVGPQKSLSEEPRDPFEEHGGGYQYYPIHIDNSGMVARTSIRISTRMSIWLF
jgi:prepilin-type N-terminal cleavage/methylation domain-containing protein